MNWQRAKNFTKPAFFFLDVFVFILFIGSILLMVLDYFIFNLFLFIALDKAVILSIVIGPILVVILSSSLLFLEKNKCKRMFLWIMLALTIVIAGVFWQSASVMPSINV